MRITKQYACSRQRVLENRHEINHDGFKDYYILRMNRDVSATQNQVAHKLTATT